MQALKFLKAAVRIGAAVIGLLLMPWLALRLLKVATPKLFVVAGALAIVMIPIGIALFLAYLNIAWMQEALAGVRSRSATRLIKGLSIGLLGNLLVGYDLILSIRVIWLKG